MVLAQRIRPTTPPPYPILAPPPPGSIPAIARPPLSRHGRSVRIIAGTAGRLAIKVPKAVARPTTDFVRQAIFSILGPAVEGTAVLDLFSGSGAIGLEALSRGAASCVFVDEHRQAESVPANDDASTSIAYIVELMVNAVKEGLADRKMGSGV